MKMISTKVDLVRKGVKFPVGKAVELPENPAEWAPGDTHYLRVNGCVDDDTSKRKAKIIVDDGDPIDAAAAPPKPARGVKRKRRFGA